jgi:hypothetical protein
MSKVNFGAALNGIEQALGAVKELMPFATALGLPGVIANVATIAISAIAVSHNVLDKAANLKEGLSTTDETKLRSMIAELQGLNDGLAEQIASEPVEGAPMPSTTAPGGTGG